MEGRRGGTNGLGEIHEELRRPEAQLKFSPLIVEWIPFHLPLLW
jgi:hypothetical protein